MLKSSIKTQKQPFRGVPRKGCSENIQQITGEHPGRSVISIKLQSQLKVFSWRSTKLFNLTVHLIDFLNYFWTSYHACTISFLFRLGSLQLNEVASQATENFMFSPLVKKNLNSTIKPENKIKFFENSAKLFRQNVDALCYQRGLFSKILGFALVQRFARNLRKLRLSTKFPYQKIS